MNRSGRSGVRPFVPLLPALLSLIAAGALALAGCGGSSDDPRRPSPGGADGALVLAERGVNTSQWKTDFSRAGVPLEEIRSGGPGKDGIPPIDRPRFVTVDKAAGDLPPREPVLVVEGQRTVRAYPHRILVWHEIVNDTLDGVPIAVTYCPLCNTAAVFDRRVDGRAVRFGTTGSLRRSDLVMWDDRTESWWQQITGEAIVGELTGHRLEQVSALTISVEELARSFPDAEVLSQDTGHDRDYGKNPYVGYDAASSEPFLLDEEADRRLEPKERVLAVRRGRDAVVVPFGVVRRRGVEEFTAFGRDLVAIWSPGVASTLDAETIGESRDVGTAVIYERGPARGLVRVADGRFRAADGTVWDLAGRAISGPRRGERLERAAHDQQFWFALAAFLTGDVRIVE